MLISVRQSTAGFAALLMSASVGAATAQAQSLTIPSGDLSTPAAARVFDHRLESAVRRLCGSRYAPLDLDGQAGCRAAVREEALAQLSPQQQQAYAETHRRPTRLAGR